MTRTGTIGQSPISVGRFSYCFENVTVRQWDEGAALRIGAFCSIASEVNIFLGGNHRTDWVTTFPFGHIYEDELVREKITGHPATKGDVVIGNDVWIGTGVTILSGVTIGDGAVICANACVAKDVLPYQIVGGNPAHALKQRFDDEIVEMLLKLRWWDLPLEAIRPLAGTLCAKPDRQVLATLLATHRGE